MGPYQSHLEAAKAIMGHDGAPVAEAFVWPEEEFEVPAPEYDGNIKDLFVDPNKFPSDIPRR